MGKRHSKPWALLAGVFYVLAEIFPGMGAVTAADNVAWATAAVIITAGVAVWHSRRFPAAPWWLYPLLFALPMLTMGVVALFDGITTLFAIGVITFVVGIGAALLSNMWMARSNNRMERTREP